MIKHYNFKKVYNFRDLGGYQSDNNQITNYKTFFRSDSPTGFLEEEIEQLVDLGLECVIDLRWKDEIKAEPTPFQKHQKIDYFNVTVSQDNNKSVEELMADPSIFENELIMGEMYVSFLNDHQFIKEVFSILAKDYKAVLFHCSAGKDRTGVIAALLLALMGVSKADIIADYQVTYTYLKPKLKGFEQQFGQYPQHMMKSEPENMERLLDEIENQYGSVEVYFELIGFETDKIKRIKKKFLTQDH